MLDYPPLLLDPNKSKRCPCSDSLILITTRFQTRAFWLNRAQAQS